MIRICPKCNREVTSLVNVTAGVFTNNIYLDKQGDLQYEQGEFEPNTDIDKYLCSECSEVLFTSESEAIAFLKGE